MNRVVDRAFSAQMPALLLAAAVFAATLTACGDQETKATPADPAKDLAMARAILLKVGDFKEQPTKVTKKFAFSGSAASAKKIRSQDFDCKEHRKLLRSDQISAIARSPEYERVLQRKRPFQHLEFAIVFKEEAAAQKAATEMFVIDYYKKCMRLQPRPKELSQGNIKVTNKPRLKLSPGQVNTKAEQSESTNAYTLFKTRIKGVPGTLNFAMEARLVARRFGRILMLDTHFTYSSPDKIPFPAKPYLGSLTHLIEKSDERVINEIAKAKGKEKSK